MLKKSPLRSRNRRSLVRQVGDRAKITGRLLEMPLAYPRYNKDADTVEFYTDFTGEKLITTVSVESLEEAFNAVVSLAKVDTTPKVSISLERDGYWEVVVVKWFAHFPQIYIQRLEQYRGKDMELAPDKNYQVDMAHILMLVVTQADIFR
jgi:hypothetical protein